MKIVRNSTSEKCNTDVTYVPMTDVRGTHFHQRKLHNCVGKYDIGPIRSLHGGPKTGPF